MTGEGWWDASPDIPPLFLVSATGSEGEVSHKCPSASAQVSLPLSADRAMLTRHTYNVCVCM